MNAAEKESLRRTLKFQLASFEAKVAPLPGARDALSKEVLASQIVDSISRVGYAEKLSNMEIDPVRGDPTSSIFDPLHAAVFHKNFGDIENACWLVFLATHFGKSIASGWTLTREIFGADGAEGVWTWEACLANREEFHRWYIDYFSRVRASNLRRTFSNHRKYESLDPSKENSTIYVLESYFDWVVQYGSHVELFAYFRSEFGTDARAMFDAIYRTMVVKRFGRTGKFDFLAMLSKLGIVEIEPGSVYLNEATGPRRGCNLLFGPRPVSAHEELLSKLEDQLLLGPMSMQVLEDAICNWQKNPRVYSKFRG